MTFWDVLIKFGPWILGLGALGTFLVLRKVKPKTVNQDEFLKFKEKLQKESADAIEAARQKIKAESDAALAKHASGLVEKAQKDNGGSS